MKTYPRARVKDLPLLTDTERRQLQVLMHWNDTARDYGSEARLHRLIEKQAAQTPDSVAVEFEGQELTYAELNRKANQLARLLRQKGVGPDVLVGVFAERSFEMVLSILAVLKAGGAYVPLDPSYPAQRLAHMLDDAQASLVLTQRRLVGQLPAVAAEVLLLDTSWAAYAGGAGEDLEDVGTPQDLAYVMFTSGSTGRPKGAMNEHRGICNRLLWKQHTFRLSPDDRVLQKSPFGFDASLRELFWPLICGARLVLARPDGHRDCDYLLELIRDRNITTVHFVPSMLRAFLETEGLETCRALKLVFCGGEVLSHELHDRFCVTFPSVKLVNIYGPSEACGDVTCWVCKGGDGRLLVPIGRPIANTQIYILNPELEPMPPGVIGELCIGGMQVGRGYVGQPDLNAERFIDDPFSDVPGARLYKTGDFARVQPDGVIEYFGRNDYQVKIRGIRIELGEIEATLDAHPSVVQSVVVARGDTSGDQRLVAYVVPRDFRINTLELKQQLSLKLPLYMVPGTFVMLNEFPLTSSGKVDRKVLRALDPSDLQRHICVAPQTTIEKVLASIWADLLAVERVSIEDNFFDLGGHSLLLTQVRYRIRKLLKMDVQFATLLQFTTVESLAKHLSGNVNQSIASDRIADRAQRQSDALRRYKNLGLRQ